MNPNFKVQSIDGFGDRDDIALERDKQEGVITSNRIRDLWKSDDAVIKANEWGTSSSAQPLTSIIKNMIKAEVGEKLLWKSDVIWDEETISDALTDACIQLGLSDEDFSPVYQDKGSQVSLRLF